MFGFFKAKQEDLVEAHKVEDMSIGIAIRNASAPKFVDSSGREFSLSNQNTPTAEQALTTSDVIFACVDFIATAVSQAKLTVYTRDTKTQHKVPFNNKAVTKAIQTSPTPTSTWSELLGMVATQVLLDGEAFITLEAVGKQFEFTAIDSNTSVEILFDEAHPEIPTGYTIGGVEYSLEEVIHVKRVNITGSLHGQSVLSSILDALVLDGYASNDLISFYENSSVGELYLHSEAPLAPSQVEQIERKLETKYTKGGRHRTFILPNGLTPKTLKMSPKDALILDAMNISEDRILRAFKLHRSILGGNIENYTHNIEGLTTIQFNQSIRPLLNLIKDKFELVLRRKLKKDDIYIDWDLSNIPEISRALLVHHEKARVLYAAGLMSLNEAREVLGLTSITDPLASEHFLPAHLYGSSMLTVESLDINELDIIRQAKVAEAEQIINGGTSNEATPIAPSGSDNPEGGTPNNLKEPK